MVGVALGVGDEVADAAPDRDRPHADVEIPAGVEADLGAVPLGVGAQILEQAPTSVRTADSAGVAAGEGEIAFEHAAHFVDVLLQELAVGGIVEQRQRQLEAGQDRAKVVADAVEHGGALLASRARSRRFISMKAWPA